jgi:UDP-2,3-diacylglucosamine hydrolase
MIKEKTKYYFISDLHLGTPDYAKSLEREKLVVQWLDAVKTDAKEIFLMGDTFDFWFEYKSVVPKGFVRLLGKLAEISDSGTPIHFFTGNHDMWCFDYLPKEIGVKIYREPILRIIEEKSFFLGHGDGLGPGDNSYKVLKKIFRNPICQFLFGWIHPNLGIGLANFWSRRSRISTGSKEDKFLGEDKEWLVQFCKEKITKGEAADFFIFGHRHLPLDLEVGPKSRYINLGEWINYFTYAEFDGKTLELKTFSPATAFTPN